MPEIILPDSDGTVTTATIAAGGGVVVTRYTDAGALASGFGSGGSITVLAGENVVGISGLIERPGGGLLVSANAPGFPGSAWVIALTSGGALNPGWAPTAPQPGILAVAEQVWGLGTDGNAVVATGLRSVLRYLADGGPDATFAGGGRLDLSLSNISFEYGSLTVAANAYFIGGHIGPTAIAVAKVLRTGVLDPTFGAGGYAHGSTDDCVPLGSRVFVEATSIRVVGGMGNCGPAPIVANRFTLSGALDTSYGAGGQVRIETAAGLYVSQTQAYEAIAGACRPPASW